MAEELTLNPNLRADSASEAPSGTPVEVKPSATAPRQPLHTLSMLNSSQNHSNSSGSGGGANEPGLSRGSEHRERRRGPGTLETGAAPSGAGPGSIGVADILRGLQGQTGGGSKSAVPASPGSTTTQEGEAEGDSEGSSSSGCTSKLRAEPADTPADVSQLSPAGSTKTEGPGGVGQLLGAKEELKKGEQDAGGLLELRLGPSPQQGQGQGQGKGTPLCIVPEVQRATQGCLLLPRTLPGMPV